MDPALLLLFLPVGVFLWQRRAAAGAEAEDPGIGEQVAGLVHDIAESDIMTGIQSEVAEVLGIESGPPPLAEYPAEAIRSAVFWYENELGGKEPSPIRFYGIGAVQGRLEELFGASTLAGLLEIEAEKVASLEALTFEERIAADVARAEELGVEYVPWGGRIRQQAEA